MKKQFTKLFAVTLMLLLSVWTTAFGQTITSTATGGLWNDINTWSGGIVPGTGNDVIIADGATVTINVSPNTLASITVGQGASGILTFDGVAARAVVVTGSITIATNGTFITQSTGTFTNTMSVGGNITNNGTFDMSRNSSTTVCTVTFNGTGEQDISGTTPVLTRFRGITLTKSSKTDPVKSTIDTQFGGSGLLLLTTGTWEQNAGNLINISGTQTLASPNGVLLIDGSGGYTNYYYNGASWVYNSASLAVTAGTFTVNTSGTVQIGVGNNSVTTGGTINLTAGTVRIYGKFVITTGTTTINGANIFIDINPTFTGASALSTGSNQFEVSGSAGTFNFTSGSVTLCNPLTSPAAGRDLKITSTGTVYITNGIFYIGDGVSTQTSSGSAVYNGFMTGSSVAIPNLVIQTGGTTGRNFGLKSNLTVGNLTMISGAIEQVASAGTVAYSANGTLTYNGTSAQTTTGIEFPTTGGPINLTINNALGVALHAARTIPGVLTLTSGTLATGANTLTLNGATSGSGLIDTGGTGTLAFGGTAVQTLASSNLTSGAVNNLIVNAGSKLTSSGTIAATNFTINSDVTNGTGTLLDGGLLTATTSNVNQYLTYRTWYMSSPVASASPTGMTIRSYDEATNFWSPATLPMVVGRGYSVTPNVGITNILFTEGALNTGEQPITLTRNGTTSQAGFNSVGNPYPSYIDWKAMVTKNTAVLETGTMWYRSKETGSFKFYTVDALGNVAPSGSTATAFIPPMQGFWVKTKAGGGTLYFEDNMRSHAGTAENPSPNALKAPAAKNTELSLLRLQVSNGINSDEAVIYSYANATNGYDFYDSPKMMNNDASIPEIYTTLNNQPIVINVMNSIPLDTEIGLGFVPGDATSFSIRANEISNLPTDVKVILKDNANNSIETDLTDGVTTYGFRTATTTGDRFSIIFRSPGAVTSVSTATNDQNLLVYRNANNQIAVQIKGQLNDSYSLDVYNSVGQRLVSKQATAGITIMDAPQSGVYFVTIKGNGNNTTKKVVIN